MTDKVAIYIRVSTHWQIDKDSLQVQRRELTAYSELVLGINNYEVFEDPGFSAKNTDRPAYQQMMAALRTGSFSHLLVWKIDRISRNLLDFAEMYAELKKLGITFVSKNEQFDTSSAIGEAMLKIILVFAELERKMTAERVTAVMVSRANNGQWNGGRIPLGYDYDKETMQFSINESEKKYIRYIFDTYEERQSILYITRALTAESPHPRTGNKWSTTAVHKILTNVFYTGDYRYNVHSSGDGYHKKSEDEWITIEDHHPALVTKQQFSRIQFLLKRNRRGQIKPGDTYEKKHVHLFAGLLRCGVCGGNMSATRDRIRADGYRPSMYACSERRKGGCNNKYISDVTLGPFIFQILSALVSIDTKNRMRLETLKKKIRCAIPENCSIPDEDLVPILNLINSGHKPLEYDPKLSVPKKDEQTLLIEQKIKYENALNRLHTLYLYGDAQLPESQYVIERQGILDEIQKIDEILSMNQPEPEISPTFKQKLDLLAMTDILLAHRTLDFEKFIRSTDPKIPKNFLNTVIESIEITQGRVTAIIFKNHITIHISYTE